MKPVPKKNDPSSTFDGSQLNFDIKEHGVVFVLPAEAILDGTIKLEGGALILGKFSGNIKCNTGSLIFAPDSYFSGHAEADKIYIGGKIGQPTKGESSLMARVMMAISSDASVRANIASRLFAINSSNVFGSMRTLPPQTAAT